MARVVIPGFRKIEVSGGGEVISKNVIISTTPIDGGNRVTFSYTLEDGTVKTSTIDVMNGKDGHPGVDGVDGIGISKIEKIGTVDLVDTYRITFTDNSTFDYEVTNGKDGQGGGTADVPIEKIKVNGELQTPVNKVVDIKVPDAYDDTDIRAELANKSDTDHTHTTVNGHTVESDVPVDAKFTDTVYDDTQVKTQIQAVANGLMDSVGYSADYKTIDIIAKNGVKKSLNVAPIISHASITELSDVDTTNKATGKALVYNATTSKHEYADVSGTDEKVKMDASTDAKYLGELLDNITIANENGELKVKKLDGQEVTITEINYLKGLTMNVMDLVNMFSNGGVKIINTPVATYAELLTIDKSSFIEGISYLVYVLADENHDNAKTTYLVDKDSETPTYFGFADSQRDFTTNPIDLATEITGKLGIANMDSDAIKALFTVDDTYKTETATNNAFSTHGAKALYDELLLDIGNKANSSDLTTHKDDVNIHVSEEDRTKWDSAKTHADSTHAPSNAQENVIETVKFNGTALTPDENKNVNIDLSAYAKKTDIPTTLPANGGNADTVNNHTVKSDVPENAVFTDTVYDDTELKGSIAELSSNLVNIESALDELENITRLTDFDEAIPEKGKNKIYYVNKVIGTYKCAQWRVESMYYDVSGLKQYRGVQKVTSINGVDNIMLMREYYLGDDNVMHWSAWKELATMDKVNDLGSYINGVKLTPTTDGNLENQVDIGTIKLPKGKWIIFASGWNPTDVYGSEIIIGLKGSADHIRQYNTVMFNFSVFRNVTTETTYTLAYSQGSGTSKNVTTNYNFYAVKVGF